MTELASVRAEIKAWERSFKESNGRAATVEDVRENSAIADKYKLYKKLSKATTAPNVNEKEKTPPRFSTPPRPTQTKEPPSALLSKSRIIRPTAPLAAFNPFSPRKKQKGKEKERFSPVEEPRRNLFDKSGSTSSSQARSLSPNPFSSIQVSSSTSSYGDTSTLPSASTSAVSRARKRLRGEPVSPSPSKEKRRRVTPNTTNLFPNLNLDALGSDDDMDTKEADSSFVDNSPTKLPSSGKLFPQLFSENEPVRTDLFGVKSKPAKTKKGNTLKLTRGAANVRRVKEVTRKPTKSNSTSAQLEFAETYKASASNRAASETPSERSINLSTNKRPASDDGAGNMEHVSPRQKSPLIPPSPPPSAAAPNGAFSRSSQLPSKGQASKSRKRAKIDERDTSDNDDEELNAKLKIVRRHETRIKHDGGVQDEAELDSDPILGHTRFAGPRASSPETAQQESGHVEVNLPDQLLRVLALESVAPQSKLPDENRVVKGLLYGRRVSHYDPSKGGEIWDIGEDYHTGLDEQGLKFGEEEEDWEGEPVPWEIAEL